MQVRIPILDRIWRAKGSVDLGEPLSAQEVFERLDPLFRTQGTEYAVDENTLSYVKANPTAQDRLATFTAGVLQVDEGPRSSRLTYDVTSTALLLCFLAPLMFLAFGQFASFVNELEKPALIEEQAQKKKEKEAEAEREPIELHWIDQMLGASAPEQSGEGEEGDRSEERESSDREDEVEGNHSPTTAYVFAGIFFVVFLVGRALEPYLLRRTLRAALSSTVNQPSETGDGLVSSQSGTNRT
jgi:hypothetical protein